ncbi:DUF4173 domain-containing protein [Nitrospirillum iridis]|uniref:DUF4173 domain-containing protein n=1 Tax=Nitrospirillum iridis TaxID=765888 RepID=A0A7X0EHZ6_9PROT|nr:DUF4173 domain-containing protein [Nitrospirillum iridis]MBB6255209.1 hypothetical protein [Nitrospirillum iridis]
MTDIPSIATASPQPGGDAPSLPAPNAWAEIALAGLATLATALFYGTPWGIALPAFLALVCGGALALNPPVAGGDARLGGIATLAAVLILLADAVTPLSLLLAIPAVAASLLALTCRWLPDLADRVRAVGAMLVRGPQLLLRDGRAAFAWWSAHGGRQAAVSGIGRWILPLGLGLIFCLLFTAANPVLRGWLDQLPVGDVDAGRVVFWMMALALLWPFLRIPAPAGNRAPKPISPDDWRQDPLLGLLLSPAAIVRALILFNALFALQSALDVYYLWTGHALPPGITHATYAHQGAYPLILTALLAALFVLVALERRPVPRAVHGLIIAWIAQNILLVLSAMLRLATYVEAYSLTLLRLAAFIWMGLVAAGLVLILARMALGRPNRWLVGANLCSLVLTLYVVGWVNVPALIAEYNVSHCLEMAGGGPALDWEYLGRLGPQTIPALDRYTALPANDDLAGAAELRRELAQRFLSTHTDWRSWTLRDQRLKDYLAAHPDGIDHGGQP